MKWLEDLKYKLWWRGISGKDIAILVILPSSIIGAVVFMLWALGQSL